MGVALGPGVATPSNVNESPLETTELANDWVGSQSQEESDQNRHQGKPLSYVISAFHTSFSVPPAPTSATDTVKSPYTLILLALYTQSHA